jgi:hypothetical protein
MLHGASPCEIDKLSGAIVWHSWSVVVQQPGFELQADKPKLVGGGRPVVIDATFDFALDPHLTREAKMLPTSLRFSDGCHFREVCVALRITLCAAIS